MPMLFGLGMIALAIYFMLSPLLRYLTIGWAAKKDEIASNFTPAAKVEYFQKFLKKTIKPADADAQFELMYRQRFGRRLFIIPLFLISATSVVLALVALKSQIETFGIEIPQNLLLHEGGLSALAGAYMWVASDFVYRSRRRDFAPADVFLANLRLIIAVPLGHAFSAVAGASTVFNVFIPFALGAFPLADIASSLRQLAIRLLRLNPVNSATTKDPLVLLQGITKDANDRLANEDVTTIGQLAYCDPVQLAMRTNYPFNFVVDIVSQALAWQFFEEKLIPARAYGVRTSFEIKTLIDAYDYAGSNPAMQAEKCRAAALLPDLAKVMGIDQAGLHFAFRVIARDPYTTFLYKVWS